MAGLMTIYGCEASQGAGPETAGEVKHIFGVKTRSVVLPSVCKEP